MRAMEIADTAHMKQILIRLAVFLSVLTCAPMLTCCNVTEMSSLKDISRPYAAEYTCKRLQIGERDALGDYEYIKLDLKYGKKFECRYRSKDGAEGAYAGTYEIPDGEESVKFTAMENGEEKSYVFPYREGKVMVGLLFRGQILYGEFSAVE